MPEWLNFEALNISDPLVRRIVLAAGALVVLALVLWVIRRRRERAAVRERTTELRRGFEELRLQNAEIQKLAAEIVATSSTSRVAGYAILRQVETVFADGRTSSAAAVELLKALAAQKGANAVINVQTRQASLGKWAASGDAVVVQLIGRRAPEAGSRGRQPPGAGIPGPSPKQGEEDSGRG